MGVEPTPLGLKTRLAPPGQVPALRVALHAMLAATLLLADRSAGLALGTAILGRAILIPGALLLLLGPGLQARAEMREYHDLLEALIESEPPAVTREYLAVLAIGPSMALHSPIGLLRFLVSLRRWYPRYRSARLAFIRSDVKHDERVAHIRGHLVRARNWAIVVLGSLLILVGTAVELVQS